MGGSEQRYIRIWRCKQLYMHVISYYIIYIYMYINGDNRIYSQDCELGVSQNRGWPSIYEFNAENDNKV